MSPTYIKATDTVHKVPVTSHIIYCIWHSRCGYGGSMAVFEVRTSFVGEGASIDIVGKSEKGKKFGKITDTIRRNRYVGELQIPDNLAWDDQIYFEAKLPKHGLQMESNRIPVRPKIQVKSLAWDRKEAREGDVVKLTAEFKNLPDGTEATVVIYDFTTDGYYDKIADFSTAVKNNKIELEWEYEYHEDRYQIPTQTERQKYGKNYEHPKYFFVVDIDEERIGAKQESGLLLFKDWIELVLEDEDGNPIPNEKYVLRLSDGSKKEGTLDGNGKALVEHLPPGPVEVEYP